MKDEKPRRLAFNSTLSAPQKEMRRFNPEKRARRIAEDLVYGSHHDWIKRQPCDLVNHTLHTCEYYADRKVVEGHHLKTVGSGGVDFNGEIPCCPGLHDEFHREGLTRMCERYRRDFRSVACDYSERFEAEGQSEEG